MAGIPSAGSGETTQTVEQAVQVAKNVVDAIMKRQIQQRSRL